MEVNGVTFKDGDLIEDFDGDGLHYVRVDEGGISIRRWYDGKDRYWTDDDIPGINIVGNVFDGDTDNERILQAFGLSEIPGGEG